MTKQKFLTAMLATLVVMPLAGQQIAQRTASDAAKRAMPAALATAPLLEAEALRKIAMADSLTGDLSRTERAALRRVSERLRHKNRAAAQQDWSRLIQGMRERDARLDVAALSDWVVNRTYVARSPELKPLADRMKYREQQRQAAHASKAQLEKTQARLEGGVGTRGLMIRSVRLSESYRPGVPAVTTTDPKPATVDSVVDELASIVVLCNKADANAQQANIDLQNALQKQQQTLQTMSNVSKMLHDTAMAVIRKIG